MKKYLLILSLCVVFFASANGQSVLNKLVTVSYSSVSLINVLSDLEDRYGLTFSYSSDLIQLDYPIEAYFEQAPLLAVLDQILGDAGIDYSEMSGLIVLRNKPKLQAPISTSHESTGSQKEFEEQIDEILEGTPPWKEAGVLVQPILVSTPKSVEQLPYERALPQPDWVILDSAHFYNQRGPAILQTSVLPYLGNYLEDSDNITANVSLNLLWGVTGGINGVELGALVNVTKGQVNGFQAGGVSNVVTGPMHGFQLSAGANINEDRTVGLQIAGVLNHTKTLQGVQLATVINMVTWRAGGAQFAGLGNIAGGRNSSVSQFGGFFNANAGTSGFQISTFLNASDEVRIGQVGLVNIAGEVEGFQLGLINIADTVAGPSIGLINIIKKGYNRFDLSYSDVLWLQSGWAFGSPRFYNLIQVGYRGSDGRASASWGLGYGIGSRLFTKKKWLSNFELYLYHINEEKFWTKEMNWLGQVRILFEKKQGFMNHLYFGPVLNISASRLNATDAGIDGTKLAPYDLFNLSNPDTNIKGWVGINAGFRF